MGDSPISNASILAEAFYEEERDLFFCIIRVIYRLVPAPTGFVLFHMRCEIFQFPSASCFHTERLRMSSMIVGPPAFGMMDTENAVRSKAWSPSTVSSRSVSTTDDISKSLK